MKLSVIAALPLALALVSPLAAQATVTANAHFSNFRYEVIDLDLNDGIAAAVTLEDSVVLSAAFFPSADTPPAPFDYRDSEGSVGILAANGTSIASLRQGVGDVTTKFNGMYGEVTGGASMGSLFKLTANTRLVLTVDASAASTADGARYGYSGVHLFISNRDLPFEVDEDTIYDTVFSTAGNGVATERTLTLSFSSGASEMDGNFAVVAGAFGTVSAVPEPSQYAMFGLGLAGLAWRLRRAGRRG